MKLSTRLYACAALVKPGNVVADIGCDHGYLSIYLIKNGISARVMAADLREQPLQAAIQNAEIAGVKEQIDFYLSDGLRELPQYAYQTVVCAGMGGDNIIEILDREKSVWREDCQLILQPQSAIHVLREYLYEQGFRILRERFARDGKFIYTIMEVFYGGGAPLAPGECFLPQGEIDREDPLYRAYLHRTKSRIEASVMGLKQAREQKPQRLGYYEAGYAALLRQEEQDEYSQ